MLGEVWESVLGCGEVLREVWKSVWGVVKCRKRCEKVREEVCWSSHASPTLPTSPFPSHTPQKHFPTPPPTLPHTPPSPLAFPTLQHTFPTFPNTSPHPHLPLPPPHPNTFPYTSPFTSPTSQHPFSTPPPTLFHTSLHISLHLPHTLTHFPTPSTLHTHPIHYPTLRKKSCYCVSCAWIFKCFCIHFKPEKYGGTIVPMPPVKSKKKQNPIRQQRVSIFS